jgi:hypothetical protein
LSLVGAKSARTAKEVWEALAAAGFRSAHHDPVHAVQVALHRRAKKHGDVLLIGRGKWGLKSWYIEAELEKIKRSVGPMGARDSEEHKERTKAGMLLAKRRGARLGAKLIMTPERVKEAEEMLAGGKTVTDVAAKLGVTRQTIYTRFNTKNFGCVRKSKLK